MPPEIGQGVDDALSEREFHALLVQSPGLRDIERGLAGFNIFRIMRFAHGELRHSNVLAWLLAPDESHGLGDRFLRRWLMRVQHDADTSPVLDVARIDAALFRSVQVQREWGHIDVLVRIQLDDAEEWIIVVENKVNAVQAKEQLSRYRSRLEASFPAAKRFLVFLTLHEEEPADATWIAADYGQVGAVLHECVAERGNVLGAEPRVLIDHYLKTIERLLMPNEELVELARQIYDQHHRALDFIFEQRIDELALLSATIAKHMQGAAGKLGMEPMRCSKGFVRFLPKAWDNPANRAGTAWGTPDSAYVLCELFLLNNQPTLKIVEGKSPAPWRTKLHEIAKADGKVLKVRAKMPGQWMSVYQHKIPNPPDDLETEDAAEAIWNACAKHITEDGRFKAASRIIAEHVKALA
jgi:hypothetical protein